MQGEGELDEEALAAELLAEDRAEDSLSSPANSFAMGSVREMENKTPREERTLARSNAGSHRQILDSISLVRETLIERAVRTHSVEVLTESSGMGGWVNMGSVDCVLKEGGEGERKGEVEGKGKMGKNEGGGEKSVVPLVQVELVSTAVSHDRESRMSTTCKNSAGSGGHTLAPEGGETRVRSKSAKRGDEGRRATRIAADDVTAMLQSVEFELQSEKSSANSNSQVGMHATPSITFQLPISLALSLLHERRPIMYLSSLQLFCLKTIELENELYKKFFFSLLTVRE